MTDVEVTVGLGREAGLDPAAEATRFGVGDHLGTDEVDGGGCFTVAVELGAALGHLQKRIEESGGDGAVAAGSGSGRPVTGHTGSGAGRG